MKQQEAIKKLKKLKDKIDFMTTPRLWTVQVDDYSITTDENEACYSEECVYDYDKEEIVHENDLTLDQVKGFLESYYRYDGRKLDEIEEIEDFYDMKRFLFMHDNDDQKIYGLVNIKSDYKIHEKAGVFLSEEECEGFIKKYEYPKDAQAVTNPVRVSDELGNF